MSHHVRWSAAGLLIVGLGVGAAQHLHLFAGNDSTSLPVGQAQQRYDESTSSTSISTSMSTGPGTTPTTTIAQLPAPGVYVYATTGRDSVDALNGAHHDYPTTTTITVTPTPRGVQQRWDVLEPRWQELQHCTEGTGISETGRTNFDEFFGQSQTDSWLCTGAPRPLAAAAGTTWSTTCTSGSATDTDDGVVVGTEEQVVGTASVDTLHVRVTITDQTPSDSQIIDTWYRTGTDLVVVQTSTLATTNATQVGTVHYAETYAIRLTSLTPSS
jgi:hypothetical protein